LVGLGKPVPEVAEELGIGTSILYGWVRKDSRPAQLGSAGLRAVGEEPAADELRRLRREVSNLKLENDILKKAAVILGTKPQPGVGR
jgi:transposase